ncbi:hypothetical protein GCM10007866_12380 [Gluconobacter albidus]|uniref:Large ribosomal subunit protein bL36 n=1 Tax=Gluconobacter albidus TaxID=318683 RepID=A0ABQ5WZ34_9PROT|nr:hypothetical protein GCM10007866_12380 [Gluconobacter albidus]
MGNRSHSFAGVPARCPVRKGLTRREPATMKIRNSLKSAKVRDKDCRVVRRRGRVYIINKKNPRMKARQG